MFQVKPLKMLSKKYFHSIRARVHTYKGRVIFIFYDFWKWANCYRLAIFLWVKFQKNQQILPRARQSYYIFKKITGTLKMNIFDWKFAETFLIHQRTIVKIKILNYNLFSALFYFSKMAKIVTKKYFWVFPWVFSF